MASYGQPTSLIMTSEATDAAPRTAARSTCWQRCRICFRPDGNCSQQPDQGIGMAEPRDSASKISPEWLNRRTEPPRKRHQKHSTGKGTVASFLLVLNPRLSRVSLDSHPRPTDQVCFRKCLLPLLVNALNRASFEGTMPTIHVTSSTSLLLNAMR